MKILMIGAKKFPNSREGGIDIVVERLAVFMSQMGHDVTVLVRKRKGVEKFREFNGIKVVSIFTINKKSLDALVYSFFATRYAQRHHFDVVHFHAEGNTFFINKTKKLNSKIITTIHGIDWKRGKFKGLGKKILLKSEKRLAKYSDKIITLCENDAKYFKDTYNIDSFLIPNGVESNIHFLDGNLITKQFDIIPKKYILFLARIVPEKGLHYLIKAFKNIAKTNFQLVIAGGSSHSSLYYNEMVELAGNASNIIFTGFVSGDILSELFSNAFLYVLPSDIEGMPLSLIEALSYKNICLCSNIDELTGIKSSNCYFFKHGDVADLQIKLTEIMDNPPRFKEEEIFLPWSRIAEKTINVYEGFIKTNR